MLILNFTIFRCRRNRDREMPYPTRVFHRCMSLCLVRQGFQRVLSGRFPRTEKYRPCGLSNACSASNPQYISPKHHGHSRSWGSVSPKLTRGGTLEEAVRLSIGFGAVQAIRKIFSDLRGDRGVLRHCLSILRFEPRQYRQSPSERQAGVPQQCQTNIVAKTPSRMGSDRLYDPRGTV